MTPTLLRDDLGGSSLCYEWSRWWTSSPRVRRRLCYSPTRKLGTWSKVGLEFTGGIRQVWVMYIETTTRSFLLSRSRDDLLFFNYSWSFLLRSSMDLCLLPVCLFLFFDRSLILRYNLRRLFCTTFFFPLSKSTLGTVNGSRPVTGEFN